jgi:sugar lactone lactonase YvrE
MTPPGDGQRAKNTLSERCLLPADLAFAGQQLQRPECVLSCSDGSRFTSDWRGGICHSHPDGEETLILALDAPAPPRPNGIALLPDGSFLFADLGALGGVWRLHRNGQLEPFLNALNGRPLPPCNFVMVDRLERVWISVSTKMEPRQRAQRPDVADGFLILVDGKGPRVVAENLGYANEALFDQDLEWLYVNETCARRLSRFRVKNDGGLGARETVHRFGPGTFPDGLGFDEDGGIWVVSIVSNRLIRLTPDGAAETILEDSEQLHLEWVEAAFQNGTMNQEHFGRISSKQLRNISSLAFGGPDRRQLWLGCLLGNQLATFRAPWAGIEPVHWHWGSARQ